jgi:hypothetical protein
MPPEDLAPKTQSPEIVDPHEVQVAFVDWFLTGGSFEGVVNLTLGTIDHSLSRSPEDRARVIVAARLRCSVGFAERLHAVLGKVLAKPAPPPDDTPPEPAPPPGNPIFH